LAGSFFHLWLAKRVWKQVFPEADETLLPVFYAGAVGPDIGFFPGGPGRFSRRVHLEKSGDFLRALLAEARDESERVFVAGWALHVYTDLAVHPWVESWVDDLLESGLQPPFRDLWHMRLEWGVDCRLLAERDSAFLWRPNIDFPHAADGSRLLAEVGAVFYGKDMDDELARKGEVATAKWLRRIPYILCLSGAVTAPRLPWLQVAGPVCSKVVGDWFSRWHAFKDAAALAQPWRVDGDVFAHALDLGDCALAAYLPAWHEEFIRLGNPELYRGQEPSSRWK